MEIFNFGSKLKPTSPRFIEIVILVMLVSDFFLWDIQYKQHNLHNATFERHPRLFFVGGDHVWKNVKYILMAILYVFILWSKLDFSWSPFLMMWSNRSFRGLAGLVHTDLHTFPATHTRTTREDWIELGDWQMMLDLRGFYGILIEYEIEVLQVFCFHFRKFFSFAQIDWRKKRPAGVKKGAW